MLRLRFSLLLVLAVVLSVEPILHNHPLIPQAGEATLAALSAGCAACTFSTARISIGAAVIHAPAIVVYALVALPESTPLKPAPIPLAARAPPALS